jgi:histidyl-tRNA synthetase
VSGQPEKVVDIVTAIDKLDKIGREKVEEEMRTKGVSPTKRSPRHRAAVRVQRNLEPSNVRSWSKWLASLRPSRYKALKDLDFIFTMPWDPMKQRDRLEFDPTLARGLDYYTGAIFEVKALPKARIPAAASAAAAVTTTSPASSA